MYLPCLSSHLTGSYIYYQGVKDIPYLISQAFSENYYTKSDVNMTVPKREGHSTLCSHAFQGNLESVMHL